LRERKLVLWSVDAKRVTVRSSAGRIGAKRERFIRAVTRASLLAGPRSENALYVI
jgi:hypothetical protein